MENGGSSDAGPSQKAAEDSAFLGGESLPCHRGSMGLDGPCGKSVIRGKAVH